ncbi:MAG: GxxExxY protein [Gracilimonas sp.]|nr:GxxExxY protein [Gracilimonas sp.]
MKHENLTHKVIGVAMKVHSEIGMGFQEVIYQRCLSKEFKKVNIPFVREFEMGIIYDGTQVGTRRVDFLIDEKVMVEIKAVSGLTDIHLAQAKNYLEAYELDSGLLINFGAPSLEFRRLFGK